VVEFHWGPGDSGGEPDLVWTNGVLQKDKIPMTIFEDFLIHALNGIKKELNAIAEELKTQKSAGGEGEKHEDNRI